MLDEVLELDAPARSRRLAELQTGDPDAAQALAELLGRLTGIERDGFLQQSPRLQDDVRPGQTIGAYQIERAIGQGGMGSVWLARRTDGRFEGQVAIKVLASGLASRAGVARFTREGSILARLAHPHIARLLDAGVTEGRQPYLVLDHVDGKPIDQHCREAALDVPARVRLCLDVLDAVAHAHNRLILHRDIKPANILVTEAGEVKLLDFGIAKLLDEPTGRGVATELTREAGNAFTMLYAAPEQVQAGEVTTATDVYALGVLLHLLLSGRHPMGDADTPLERMRQLVEVEPPLMSQALAVLRQRGAANAQLARDLRGDLDTIVAKALKKSPAERYANAQQLADDLRRWLADEPILARRDAGLYRLRKFVVRHRVGVAAGMAVLLALAVGIGMALWQAAEARAQRVQAEDLIEFMLGDLRAKLQPVGRLDALDAVGGRVMAYYARQDQARLDAESLGRRARAQHLIGEIAETRGKLPEAIAVFTQAEASTAALLARDPQDAKRIFDHAQSVYWLGYIAYRQWRLVDALTSFGRYEALAQRLVGLDANNPTWQTELAFAHQNLGSTLLESGDVAQAHAKLLLAEQALTALVRTTPELRSELTNNMGWLAKAQERLGQLAAALATQRRRIATLLAHEGASQDRGLERQRAVALAEVSRLELALGQVDAARDSAKQGLAILAGLSASDTSNLAWREELAAGHVRLANALRHLPGQRARALAESAAALRIVQQLQQVEPQMPRNRFNLLGSCLLLQAATAPPEGLAKASTALADWLDRSNGLDKDFARHGLVSQVALLLGDLAMAHADRQSANRFWQLAADQLSGDELGPDLLTAVYAAAAHARLGDAAKARQLAGSLRATELRHPDLAEIFLLQDRP
jgi:hypothetical protein